MTEHDILDAIGDMDPAYLEEARRRPASRKVRWERVSALAACFLLLLIFPVHVFFLKTAENSDFTSAEDRECVVYFVQDGALYYETADILGGDAEMFEAWARKNGIAEIFELKDISFVFTQREDGLYEAAVTVPASLSRYFEGEYGVLRLDSLKRTVASYRDIGIALLSVTYS